MILNYKKHEIIVPILNESEFSEAIQINGVVSIKSKNDDKISLYQLLGINNASLKTVSEFRKMINKIKNKDSISNMFFISNVDINQQVYKVITREYGYYNVIILRYRVFSFEIPKHALSAKHEILDPDQVKTMMHDLALLSVNNLPKIRIDDPQCIWIGAEKGQVVKITNKNGIGKSIKYRLVVGSLNRRVKMLKTKEKEENKKLSVTFNKKIDIKIK